MSAHSVRCAKSGARLRPSPLISYSTLGGTSGWYVRLLEDAVRQSGTPAEQRVSPDAERILGRAPRPFAEWARRHVAAFR
ncbi:hypothetical protein QF034_006786 [Streptomyces africanus]|uniref:Uncharacterized protein n=1 Tax=Streptomyces africanus TaxID=231024 RepID=A0ABU0QYS2_9ACTN|nr:hypothetical protein [Streptomyces africanus]